METSKNTNGCPKNGKERRFSAQLMPTTQFINDRISNALRSPRNDGRQRSTSCQNEFISLRQMDQALNSDKRHILQNKSISFCGMTFVIDTLLKTSAGITDKKGREVLNAVENSDIKTLKRLCSNDPSALLAAVVESIGKSNDAILLSLIELSEETSINFLEENGCHLLCLAAENIGCVKCCRVLLQKGVSSNQKGSENHISPLHAAAKSGNKEALEIMVKDFNANLNIMFEGDETNSVLHQAVQSNSPDIVRYLLNNGATNTSRGKFSCTALHIAADHNYIECAKILLDDGALIDALRGETVRETALHLAAENGYYDMCCLLLSRGADANAQNDKGETPLHLACKALADPVIQLLVEKGSHVDAKDKEGRPPLHHAINSKLNGGTKCMRILLDNGADVNLVDNSGTTPMHLAAFNERLGRANLLIERGADLCTLNKSGKSAFYTVIKHLPDSLKAIEKRLDSGLQLQNPESGDGGDIKMDFTTVIPKRKSLSPRSEIHLFSEVIHLQQTDPSIAERLLMHPLSEGYLQLKWARIKWLYFIGLVMTHLIYSITYSVYAVLVFKNLCKPLLHDSITSQVVCNFNYTVPSEIVDHRAKVVCAQIAWIFLIIFTLLYFAKECTKLVHLKRRYLLTLESWLNNFVILTVVLITFYVTPFSKGPTVYRWQYHACGFGVFSTWLLQMFLIGKVPRFGKYVEMFKNVSTTFSNFFVAYIFLFVSFAVSFFILFPTNDAFKEVIPAALVKVLVMMLGELEYDQLYYPQNQTLVMFNSTHGTIEDETVPQYFPFTAHILVTLFILLVSIIIMNLLFGLAVTDIQELYKVARLHQLIQQVELITYMENILFSPLFGYFPDCIQKILRHFLQGLESGTGYKYVKIIRMNDYSDKSLSIGVKKKIMDRCNLLYKSHLDKSKIELDVEELKVQLQTIESLLREVLGQKNGPTYSRTSTIMSFDSDDVTDFPSRRNRIKPPEYNEAPRLSNACSCSASLSRICEESNNPNHVVSANSVERV